MDKKIKGGDTIPGKGKKQKDTPSRDTGKKVLSCVGDICVTEDGIEIKLDSVNNPKCAEAVTRYLYQEQGENVKIILTSKPTVETEKKED